MEPAGRDPGRACGVPRSGTSDALFRAKVQSFPDNFYARLGAGRWSVHLGAACSMSCTFASPKNIDARSEAGHWEGDLIICKRTRPVLVLHERKSRVTLAARLVGKTAAETISG